MLNVDVTDVPSTRNVGSARREIADHGDEQQDRREASPGARAEAAARPPALPPQTPTRTERRADRDEGEDHEEHRVHRRERADERRVEDEATSCDDRPGRRSRSRSRTTANKRDDARDEERRRRDAVDAEENLEANRSNPDDVLDELEAVVPVDARHLRDEASIDVRGEHALERERADRDRARGRGIVLRDERRERAEDRQQQEQREEARLERAEQPRHRRLDAHRDLARPLVGARHDDVAEELMRLDVLLRLPRQRRAPRRPGRDRDRQAPVREPRVQRRRDARIGGIRPRRDARHDERLLAVVDDRDLGAERVLDRRTKLDRPAPAADRLEAHRSAAASFVRARDARHGAEPRGARERRRGGPPDHISRAPTRRARSPRARPP